MSAFVRECRSRLTSWLPRIVRGIVVEVERATPPKKSLCYLSVEFLE